MEKKFATPMIIHAKPNQLNNHLGDVVVSINWQKAANRNSAFIDEFIKQCKRGVGNSTTYNIRWSPGRRLFFG